ncbi:unnamed protein product [Rotaria sordida]|uniref:Uncharacterized protein n=1 Tax=Rotaria sordida TaxID=392033 RepID=A0A819Q1G6_9BILA|nr:unnamed protein product [Rotaria sordida]CAF4024078.1 unnamed protein product [Rotaria sordida]
MTSARAKQPCIKCNKGGGIATCGGCQAWFCTKHFIEHRQGLGEEINRVGQKHDDLYKNLTTNSAAHPIFSKINDWEKAAIIKIQEIAEKARSDLARYINEPVSQLQQSLSKLRNELASSRESDDYTEIDLTEWTEQLEKLRKVLKKASDIYIVEDDQSQALIRVIQKKGT